MVVVLLLSEGSRYRTKQRTRRRTVTTEFTNTMSGTRPSSACPGWPRPGEDLVHLERSDGTRLLARADRTVARHHGSSLKILRIKFMKSVHHHAGFVVFTWRCIPMVDTATFKPAKLCWPED